MRQQAGFTLIEALTTGIISTIVAGSLLSVLYMSNSLIREGSALSRLDQDNMVVSDQIRRTARNAFWVKINLGEIIPIPMPKPGLPDTLKEVIFCDSAGTQVGGFKFDPGGDSLLEWGPVVGYHPLKIGSEIIRIRASESGFGVLPNRRGIKFHFRFIRKDGDSTFTYPVLFQKIQCRSHTR